MMVVSSLMQLAPGLIAVRMLWHKRATNGIERKDYKFIACDYLIYSFLIQLAVYGIMFITYPERTVSFAVGIGATSHVLSASFVFKYSVAAIIAAVVLPVFVPWLIEYWLSLEIKRGKNETEVNTEDDEGLLLSDK